MQTTLDVDNFAIPAQLILRCEHQTQQFRQRAERIGWFEVRAGRWMVAGTPEVAQATRRLLGKGLLVTQAAGDWYRAATS